MKGEKLTKKEIVKLIEQLERLGMNCSITKREIKQGGKVEDIRIAFMQDSSIIQCQINDIGRLLHAD